MEKVILYHQEGCSQCRMFVTLMNKYKIDLSLAVYELLLKGKKTDTIN